MMMMIMMNCFCDMVDQLKAFSRDHCQVLSQSQISDSPRVGDLRGLTFPVLYISESCIETKINLNFYFHTSLWRPKRFYEGLIKRKTF